MSNNRHAQHACSYNAGHNFYAVGSIRTVPLIESWICPTCNCTLTTPYCAQCGERSFDARDLTVRGLINQLVHAISRIDRRLIRSLRSLVTAPGSLTIAYLRGLRMPYIAPLPLFLLANVLFFATQSLTNTSIISATLDSHLQIQDWHGVAQVWVSHRLEQKQITLAAYAPVFNKAEVLNAKLFIFLMILPLTGLLAVLFRSRSQPFVAHAIFSIHFYAFLLLLFCLLLVVALIDVRLGGAGLGSARIDNIMSIFNVAVCASYMYFATGRVYGARGVMRVVKVFALTVSVAVIFLSYRFVLFAITLYTT
jgi:Protein of unknown function (DUF3667)